MTISTRISLAFASLVFVLACENKTPSADVQGGSDCVSCAPDVNKPAPRPAPIFSKSQFKKGQWIQWQGDSASGGFKQCLKWTLTTPTSFGYRIEGRRSGDCVTWDADYVEHISFNAQTGAIIEHKINTGHGTETGPLKTIFNHLYGSPEKVSYIEGQYDMDEKKKLPGFQLYGEPRVFLNQKGHAFHAMVLGWIEKDESEITWNYKVVDSDPKLPIEEEAEPETRSEPDSTK